MDMDQLIIGVAAGLTLCGLWLLTRSFFRVEEGEVALLSRFGALERVGGRARTYPPGLHLKAPWTRAIRVEIKEQNLDLTAGEGGHTAMTRDGTLLRFESILRFRPSLDQLERYALGLQHPREHVTSLFTCLLRSEIATYGGDEPARELEPEAGGAPRSALARLAETRLADTTGGAYARIRRERGELNARIARQVGARVEARYGVVFSAIDLTDILPPDELADALNAVLSARSTADTHIARAESEARQRLVAAERGVEIAAQRARAAEIEARSLGAYLSELDAGGVLDAYVARRRAEILSDAKSVFVKSSEVHT